MEIKVTTLVENYVKGRGVKAEHGLSMLFEVGEYLLLFDTGASNLFIENAKTLEYRIEDVDYLILSHGHSDHTGGLRDFLKINSKAKVICKSSIFTPKYRGDRENGIGDINDIDISRFIFIDKLTEITDGIFVLPDIDITNPSDTHFSNFELIKECCRISDTFDDELALIVTNGEDMSIFSACSHRGITNIISSARRYFPTHKFNYLVGGFHLIDSPFKDALYISDALKRDLPQKIGVCHCTGLESFSFLKNEFQDRVFYNYCGSKIVI